MPPMYVHLETIHNSHCNQNLIRADFNSELFKCPERRHPALWQSVQREISRRRRPPRCPKRRSRNRFCRTPMAWKMATHLHVHAGHFVIRSLQKSFMQARIFCADLNLHRIQVSKTTAFGIPRPIFVPFLKIVFVHMQLVRRQAVVARLVRAVPAVAELPELL